MDPLTQASLGAAAASVVCRRPETRRALLLGALAGAAPDLDVFLSSETDPLLALQYHRHFTHALFMAPLIGMLVAALFRGVFFWKPWPYHRLALFGVAGALTHGLIDACTSYGTLLYWPFSNHRESWDVISIIDPIFTLPLVLLLIIAFAFRTPRLGQVGIVLCLIYLSLSLYQRGQATAFAIDLAKARGHHYEDLTVRPSFANTVLWRIVYRVDDFYYIDAVHTLPFGEPVHYPGGKVSVYSQQIARDETETGSTLAQDVERFRFFSQGYLHRHPQMEDVVGDTRYAMFPDSTIPMWGIRLNPATPSVHVSFEHFREASPDTFDRLWQMIQAKPVDPVP